MSYLSRALIVVLSFIWLVAGKGEIHENEDIPLITLEDIMRTLKGMENRIMKGIVDQIMTCAPPFEEFEGLCLWFNNEYMTWKEAEEVCAKKGSHLTWMQSQKEHEIINNFAHNKKNNNEYLWYWIGLYRHENGSLIWSNSATSSNYRAEFHPDPPSSKSPFVLAYSYDYYFYSETKSTKIKSICRDEKKVGALSLILQNQRELLARTKN